MTARDDPHELAAARSLAAAFAAAAGEAGATRALLEDATSTFMAVTDQVVAVVGGSAVQVDRQLTQSLQDAARHTRSAIAALALAASLARNPG